MIRYFLSFCFLLFSVRGYKLSQGFFLDPWNFTCPQVQCTVNGNALLQNAYFHMLIGTDHPVSFPLLVFRVCDAFMHCIAPSNFILVLHIGDTSNADSVSQMTNFLDDNLVQYTKWFGLFSPDNKMEESYKLLKEINDPNRIIYHTDIDELPDYTTFNQALIEISSGYCDAINGYWVERVTADGSLSAINLYNSVPLVKQFPLRCEVSNNVVGGGMTRKTVAYRSNLRVDGGQHDVWCFRGSLKQRKRPMKSKGPEAPGSSRRLINMQNEGNIKNQKKVTGGRSRSVNMTRLCTEHIASR